MQSPVRALPFVEILESRIAPATLDVVNAVATYTAAAGEANTLSLSIDGSDQYVFSDTGTISLTAAAIAAGFSGDGTNTVQGPNTAVSSISVALGDQNDSFTLGGLADPLSVSTEAGATDSISITSPVSVGGALSLTAETITINGAISGATNVTLTADTLAINSPVGVTGVVSIASVTAFRHVSLGPGYADSLNIPDATLDLFSAPTKIVIGSAQGGSIIVGEAITLTNTNVLSLISGGTVADGPLSSISVDSLAVNAPIVDLSGPNEVHTIAGESWPSQSFKFTDPSGFTIGTVDGLTGFKGGPVQLNAGSVTQASGAKIATSLLLRGPGPFTLTDPTNSIGVLAASTTGSIEIFNPSQLYVGTVGAVNGITSSSGGVVLRTNGPLVVSNANSTASPDIDAGSGDVSLTGSFINFNLNAGLTTSGSVHLNTDSMEISASVHAGSGYVFIGTLGGGTQVDLGGGNVNGVLALTDAELDAIDASTIEIITPGAVVNVSGAISPAVATTLQLQVAHLLGYGSIAVDNLDLITYGEIELLGNNDVECLSILQVGSGTAALHFNDGAFALGTPSGPLVKLPAGSTLNLSTQCTVLTGTDFVFGVDASGVTGKMIVSGSMNLSGADLVIDAASSLPSNTELILIAKDGTAPVVGTFNDLPEGAIVPGFSPRSIITYTGGDGNDVAIVPAPLQVTLSSDHKSATFTDVDGDIVTIKTSRGTFDGSEFRGIEFSADHLGQLQTLTLGPSFKGANLTITAKPSPLGGNGFVNVGFIDAGTSDLGNVKIAGDLGRIDAGAMKSLTVQSFGTLGVSTQAVSGSLESHFTGRLGKLTVKSNVHGATLIGSASIDTVNVLGSFVGGQLSAGADLGAVSVRGDIVGTEAAPVVISAFGKAIAPKAGKDVAIKSLKVAGSVESLRVLGGYDTSLAAANADAGIGAIIVGGDWRASTVLAGAGAGIDSCDGTDDDTKLAGAAVRDVAGIFSQIASIAIKGQALGTLAYGDTFGIVAEKIGSARIGTQKFKLDAGERDDTDVFALAPTGQGGTDLPSDLFLREIVV